MKVCSMLYVIPGEPIPLQRPRYSRTSIRPWDSQKACKLITGITISGQHRGPLLEGSLHLDVKFYLTIPRSYSAKKREASKGQPYLSVPDLDNMVKYIQDVCNGVCYHDDAQITRISAIKCFDDGKGPRTEFTLLTANGD